MSSNCEGCASQGQYWNGGEHGSERLDKIEFDKQTTLLLNNTVAFQLIDLIL